MGENSNKKISKIDQSNNLCVFSYKISKKILKNSDYLDLAYKSLVSIDLFDTQMLTKPKAILSLKDFQRHENAIIQKSNILKTKTFTTQHTVHPNFIGDNERGGNLVFLNCEGQKNLLLWGNFLKISLLKILSG